MSENADMMADQPETLSMDRRIMILGAGFAGVLATASSAAGQPAAAQPAVAKRLPGPAYAPDDKFFGPAYVDVDEWRDRPIRHRYVHGGFDGTDTRFSIYLPPPELYGARFFQVLQGGPGGSENTATDVTGDTQFGVVPPTGVEHAFDQGGYLVESNQGHLGADLSGAKGDATIIAFRASAVSARYAKIVAAQMYGRPARYGYIYGGSGGAIRSIDCFENVPDLWDGAVPFVMPHLLQGHFYSIQANATRLIGAAKLRRMADAIEVGGSGDPFAGLDLEQAEALGVLYKTGYPRHVSLVNNAESALVWIGFTAYFDQNDPTYWTDFWNKPGYLGHDRPDLLEKARMQVPARVARVLTAEEARAYEPSQPVVDELGAGPRSRPRATVGATRQTAIVLEGIDTSRMGGAAVRIMTGAAAGREVFVFGVIGDALMSSPMNDPHVFDGVKPGDQVIVDNSKHLSYCYWYRHQVDPRFPELSHSMVDGRPIFPQRPILRSLITFPYRYLWPAGKKKMIVVNNMMDNGTWPCGAVSYREHLRANAGGPIDDRFRIWFNEHARHGAAQNFTNEAPVETTRLIDYRGIVHQALTDLVAWVEKGVEPPAETAFDYTRDSEVVLASTAATRGGVQPLVTLAANGKRGRLEVKRGEPVRFEALVDTPPGGGALILSEWDFDGRGAYPERKALDGKSGRATLTATHAFAAPGQYFPAVRVTAHRTGQVDAKLYRIVNLGRIRVVVT